MVPDRTAQKIIEHFVYIDSKGRRAVPGWFALAVVGIILSPLLFYLFISIPLKRAFGVDLFKDTSAQQEREKPLPDSEWAEQGIIDDALATRMEQIAALQRAIDAGDVDAQRALRQQIFSPQNKQAEAPLDASE